MKAGAAIRIYPGIVHRRCQTNPLAGGVVRIEVARIAALYLACLVAPKWVLPAVAAVGLIESLVSLRSRAAAPKFGA